MVGRRLPFLLGWLNLFGAKIFSVSGGVFLVFRGFPSKKSCERHMFCGLCCALHRLWCDIEVNGFLPQADRDEASVMLGPGRWRCFGFFVCEMGVSKNNGFYPKSSHVNRVWIHYFHHPFWGFCKLPLFLVQHPNGGVWRWRFGELQGDPGWQTIFQPGP